MLSTYGLSTMFDAGVTLAIAASGASIVKIVGGFDFSVGSALSVINVVIATKIGMEVGDQVLMVPLAILVGVALGLINGLLVTRLKISPIVATLASSFLWGGVALLILSRPGGSVPSEFTSWFIGLIGGVIPISAVGLAVMIVFWLWLKRTRLGRAFYLVGGNPEAARLNGISVDRTIIAAYALAGLYYGVAGLFLTALTASGDPNIGTPLLLPVFAAIAIGGVRFGGGEGDIIGVMIAAYILYMISDLLFAFGISSFYTNILNGALLLAAVTAPATVAWLKSRIRTGGRDSIWDNDESERVAS